MRNVHSDVTFLKNLIEEERQKCETLVREYNYVYGKLDTIALGYQIQTSSYTS